jgi:nucleotide-binding universal stress UspA family protein
MPRWVSVAGYLGLGWFAAFVLPQLAAGTGIGALLLIVAGGGLPAKTLLEAATGADMLVVGSRGAGGFQRLRLGSVSTQVTHHAPCPVVVITAGDA